MTPSSSFFPAWLIFVIVGGFLIGFPLIWCFVGWLISRISGWNRLAQRYPAADRVVSGESHRRVNGMVGLARYRGVLTLHLNNDGFFLEVMPIFRLGHDPLFIPWSAVTSRTPVHILWAQADRLTIGQPVIATISLPSRVLAGHPKPPPLPK